MLQGSQAASRGRLGKNHLTEHTALVRVSRSRRRRLRSGARRHRRCAARARSWPTAGATTVLFQLLSPCIVQRAASFSLLILHAVLACVSFPKQHACTLSDLAPHVNLDHSPQPISMGLLDTKRLATCKVLRHGRAASQDRVGPG